MTPKERLVTVREDAPKDQVLALLHSTASKSSWCERRPRAGWQ